MILQEIILRDFRVFYGAQVIEFSQDKEKNITIINAENGSGKTTLLEAIRWCLYGKSLNLRNPKEFLNKRAAAELSDNQETLVSVEIKFKDDNFLYTAKRIISVKKNSVGSTNGKESFSLRKCYIDPITNVKGDMLKIDNPEREIQNMIPSDINFFFDGERLKAMDKKSLKNSIEGVLGVNTSLNAIKHLSEVAKSFKNEYTLKEKQLNNTPSESLLNTEISLKGELNRKYKSLEEARNQRSKASIVLEDSSNKLGEIKEVEALVKQKEGFQQDLLLIENNEREIKAKLLMEYRKSAYLAPITKLVKDISVILKEKQLKKEIPSKVSVHLIDDILNNQMCICGRPVNKHSEEEKALIALTQGATTDDLTKKFHQALEFTSNKEEDREEFFSNIKFLKEQIGIHSERKESKQRELSEIDFKIGNTDLEAVRELKLKIDKATKDISTYDQDIGKLNSDIEKLKNDIDENKVKQIKVSSKTKDVQLLKDRMEFTEELKANIKKLLELKKESIRGNLNAKIQKIYEEVSRKDYSIKLNDDFIFSIIDKSTNTEAPVSEGEYKIVALCFIGALADLARELYSKKSEVEKGMIFPIVLDSPFGDLDPDYRAKVAKILPMLSDQVVLLASSSQYTQEVKENMFPKVGEGYHLLNKNPKETKGVKHEYTEIYRRLLNGEWVLSGINKASQ